MEQLYAPLSLNALSAYHTAQRIRFSNPCEASENQMLLSNQSDIYYKATLE